MTKFSRRGGAQEIGARRALARHPIQIYKILPLWSGASRGARRGVATLKERKGAFEAFNKGSGSLGKWSQLVAPSEAPPEELYLPVFPFNFRFFDVFFLRLDVSNRRSRFAIIRIATGSQRFKIARFESQGQQPFESLLRLYYVFTFQIGFKSANCYGYRHSLSPAKWFAIFGQFQWRDEKYKRTFVRSVAKTGKKIGEVWRT